MNPANNTFLMRGACWRTTNVLNINSLLKYSFKKALPGKWARIILIPDVQTPIELLSKRFEVVLTWELNQMGLEQFLLNLQLN